LIKKLRLDRLFNVRIFLRKEGIYPISPGQTN